MVDLVDSLRGRASGPPAAARVVARPNRQRPPRVAGASGGQGLGRPRPSSSSTPSLCRGGQKHGRARRGGRDHQGGPGRAGVVRAVHIPLYLRRGREAGHPGRWGGRGRRSVYVRAGRASHGSSPGVRGSGLVRPGPARDLPRLDDRRPAGPLSGVRRRARDAVCRASRERPPQRCALVPLLRRPPGRPGGRRPLDRFQRPPLVDGGPGGRGP